MMFEDCLSSGYTPPLLQWYASKLNNTMELEMWKAADVDPTTVRSGGNLVLLQEQDNIGQLHRQVLD